MTQPNPDAPAPVPQNPPQAPATGPAAPAPTTGPPAAPGTQPGNDGDGDHLGEAGKKALAAERERAKAAEKLVTDLQQQLTAMRPAMDMLAKLQQVTTPADERTDLQQLQEKLAAVEKTAAEERLARLRLEVIQAKGLTPAHAEWLRGSTVEELAASADQLIALFPGAQQPNGQQPAGMPGAIPGVPRPDPTQGARGGGPDLQAQIKAAEEKGDVKTSILLKQQQRALQQQ